jgi:hypothetical protein
LVVLSGTAVFMVSSLQGALRFVFPGQRSDAISA